MRLSLLKTVQKQLKPESVSGYGSLYYSLWVGFAFISELGLIKDEQRHKTRYFYTFAGLKL